MENKDKKPFDIIGKRKIIFAIPIIIFAITIIFNCIFGLEVAIEFRGGTMLTYSYTGDIDTNAVKSYVEGENLGTVKITTGSSMNSNMETMEISFASTGGLTADVQTDLSDKLKTEFKDNNLELVNSKDVNPSSGSEFFLKCLVAVLFSFILLVVYIAFRFKKIGGWSAGVFALVALVHDVFMVYASFVFLRFPIDANFMAVILTILGYSINNTIVIYDRIRENRSLYGTSMPLRELVNLSIAQSLRRSINTTITTGVAVVVICIVCAICGVTSIMSFALPMVIGLICGVYSSLLISGPLWVSWREKHGGNSTKQKEKTTIDTKKIMV